MRAIALLSVMIIIALLIPVSQSMWTEMLGVSGSVGLGLPDGTATAGPSCAGADPSLEFSPDDPEIQGCPPYQVSLQLANDAEKGFARNVEVTLSVVKGKDYVQSVGLPGGQTWDPSSAETCRLSVGDIGAGKAVAIGLTVETRPEFLRAGEPEVKLKLVVTGEDCRPGHNADGHVKAHVTLLPTSGCAGVRMAPIVTVTATETPMPEWTETPMAEWTETPMPEWTETPMAEWTETPMPESTETPMAEWTETPVPEWTETPMAEWTETPVPESTETPVPQATDTPVPTPEPTVESVGEGTVSDAGYGV